MGLWTVKIGSLEGLLLLPLLVIFRCVLCRKRLAGKKDVMDASGVALILIIDQHDGRRARSAFVAVIECLFEDGRVQTASRVMVMMIDKNVGVGENMDLVGKILEALLMRGHVEKAMGRIDLLNQKRAPA
ncbi:unnamed protein product [Brassica rapa]|uniref:Pentatricopeptide repeat-containing protein n=1 Tax=Brassica campestris TaxID=3711 RepID=A0A8D9I2F7_BRACM|nr:unnamed protein product [Brassica rapa]